MAERKSEYARKERDDYATPAWVTEALLTVESFPAPIWECAPGDGHMVRALRAADLTVIADPALDFLRSDLGAARSIISNPPYNLATEFVERALELTYPTGKVAMLLPMAWDAAHGRRPLFEHKNFKAKYVLTKRIRWANLEQRAAGPSMNHAWFVWSWRHAGGATIGYLPRNTVVPFEHISEPVNRVIDNLKKTRGKA